MTVADPMFPAEPLKSQSQEKTHEQDDQRQT